MSIQEFLLETTKQLKLDLDSFPYPEWYRLKNLFNFLYYFQGHIEASPTKNAYHLFANVPSNIELQRSLRDCKGRIFMQEKRQELIGVPSDIIFKTKSQFKYIKTSHGVVTRTLKKPTAYELALPSEVLSLPFFSKLDFHHKHRAKWLNKTHGQLIEKKKGR